MSKVHSLKPITDVCKLEIIDIFTLKESVARTCKSPLGGDGLATAGTVLANMSTCLLCSASVDLLKYIHFYS